MSIAGHTLERAVPKGVSFTLDLAKDNTYLLTWLYDEKGNAGGAYFTDVAIKK